MSKKFSAARKRAFLNYLAQSGNITLSAERAKVSRSWVCLQRSTDAGFDAACGQAIEAARERFGAPPHPAQPAAESPSPAKGRGANRPPTQWRYQDGIELVVSGSNSRRVQVRRARVKQWTPRAEARFLSALSATCSVKAACAEVGMWPGSAYNHRKRWPAFAARWDEALEEGYVRLEMALIEAGCNLFADDEEMAEPGPIGEMTAEQAVHLLHMHKHFMAGRVGRKPGLPERQPSWDEVGDYFTRALAVTARAKARRR